MFYFDLFEDTSHVDLELAFEAEGDLSLPINHERIFFFIAHSNVGYLAHVLKMDGTSEVLFLLLSNGYPLGIYL